MPLEAETGGEQRVSRRPRGGLLYFLAFLLIAAAYFHRIFIQGDIPVFGDGIAQLYPMHVFAAQTGLVPPLWDPYIFAGMPFVGLMQTAAYYPPNIILYSLMPAAYAFNASFLLHYAMAGFFTFLLLRELGLSKTAAFFGASVFAFSGFVISTKQHVAILDSAVWLPLIVYMAERLKRSLSLRHALGLALAVAVQVLAGNFQVCAYTYIVLVVYFLFSLWDLDKGRRFRFTCLLIAGGALGLLIAAPQIYATWQMSGESLRPVVAKTLGYSFAKEFHVYLKTLPSMVFPHLYSRAEFGTRLPLPGDRMIVFIGILPLALSVLALVKGWRSRTIRLWAAVGIVGLVLAAADDTPLGALLFHVPVYGMFHANGRNMLELSLAVSVLFAFGMEHVLSDKRNLKAALVALAGVLVASDLALAAIYYTQGKGAHAAIAISNPAIFVPLIFFALYTVTLAMLSTGGRRRAVVVFVIFALVMAEAYTFGAYHESGWTSAASLNAKCEDSGYDYLKGLEGEKPFRVAWADMKTRDQFNVDCGVAVFNSYDQLIPARYAYLFDLEPFGFSRYWENLIVGNSLMSMMNVKYLMVPSASINGLDDINTVDGAWRPGDLAAAWKGPFPLPDPANPARDAIRLEALLQKGAYVVTIEARSTGPGDASLAMDMYNGDQERMRTRFRPYSAYPGIIGPEPREYYKVYLSDRPQVVGLGLSALRKEPMEITDITIGKLEGFGPVPIAASGRVYEKLRSIGDYDVYLNRNALPRAYSVTETVASRDMDDVRKLFDLNIVNPARQAVVFEADLPDVGGGFSKAKVDIEHYGRESVTLKTSSAGRSFIVLADQYFPGWKALVDGKPTRIFRTNGVVRGVVVSAGEHHVVFRYAPSWLVGLLGSVVLAIVAVMLIILLRRRELKV